MAKRRAKKTAKRKPVRKKAAKRRAPKRRAPAAKRKVAKKSAKRRAPAAKKKIAKRRATKSALRAKARVAKKPTRRAKARVAKKPARRARARVAKKPARRASVAKKPARGATLRAARPSLALVKRPAPKPAPKPRRTGPPPPAFAGARAGASGKDLALFELVRARVAVHAAVQGMDARSADRPPAPGKWSPRQTLVHLAYWDHEMTAALEDAYLHNHRPALTHDDIQQVNPPAVAELEALHDWEGAKRLLHLNRERLLESLQSIPEEPAEVWAREHAVGWLCRLLTEHDRHHADQLKAARGAAERV